MALDESGPSSQGSEEEPDKRATFWLDEIKRAEKWAEPWVKRVEKIIKRFRDERDIDVRSSKYNILWSNVQTLLPALYSKAPKPIVERRYKDKDPLGKDAAQILERCLLFFNASHGFDTVAKATVFEYLLSGRGTAWVRYVPYGKNGQALQTDNIADDEEVTYEEVVEDYVYYKDFLHSPARMWEEVRWVARKTFLTRREVAKHFGKEVASTIPYNVTASNVEDDNTSSSRSDIIARSSSKGSKACVYEIWDKDTRKAYWVAKDWVNGILREVPDPLGLKNFFPCPKPLYASLTPDSLLPIPDFTQYQDQAREIDELTARIMLLSKAIAVRGAYDASFSALSRLINASAENDLIPIDNWPQFQQSGGFDGVVQFMPVEKLVEVLRVLYDIRSQLKADLYEITGISDIIRGATNPRETASAQQIKSQFATIRLQDRQAAIAEFLRELNQIKAEIISEHFAPETIAQISGVNLMGPEVMQNFTSALQLLKDDSLRTFRVAIETDSTLAVDETTEKQARSEFLTAVGQFMQTAAQIKQVMPELAGVTGEMLLFMARGFRVGRNLESTIEQSIEQAVMQAQIQQSQPPPPPPELVKIQEEAKVKQQELALEREIAQAKANLEREQMMQQLALKKEELEQELELKRAELIAELEIEKEKAQLEIQKMQADIIIKAEESKQRLDFESMKFKQQHELEREKMAMTSHEKKEEKSEEPEEPEE